MRRVAIFYRRSFEGLPRAVWLASAVMLVNRAGTMVMPFLSLYLVERLALPPTAAGWFLAAFGLGSVAGSHLGGVASERFGARRVFSASLVSGGVVFLLLGTAQGPVTVAVLLFLVSTLGDAARPAVMSYVTDAAPAAAKTRALALLRLAINVGMAAGPAIGGFLAAIDYFWLFVGDGTTCLAAGALAALALPRLASEEAGDESADPPVVVKPWRDGPFVLFLGLVFLTTVIFLQLLSTVPIWLRQEAGLTEVRIGVYFTVNALLVTFLEMPLVHAAERVRPLVLCGVGAFLVCLGLGILPLAVEGYGLILLTVVVWSAGEMLLLPFSNALVAHRAPAGRSERYMGAYVTVWSVAMLVAPVVGMAVYAGIGPEAFWLGIVAAGALLGVAFPGVGRWFRERREGEAIGPPRAGSS